MPPNGLILEPVKLPFQLGLAFGGIFAFLLWLGFRLVPAKARDRENTKPGRQPRNVRAFRRMNMDFRVKLGWKGWPEGAQFADGVDFHEAGALVIARQPVPAGTMIFAHFDTFHMGGFAYVRHCSPKGSAYAIGLEFRGPLLREHMAGWNVCHTRNKWNNGVIG